MRIYIKTYGIACVEEKDGRLEVVASVNGVTTDLQQADRLVSLFNYHSLSPEHLEDVVEDILALI